MKFPPPAVQRAGLTQCCLSTAEGQTARPKPWLEVTLRSLEALKPVDHWVVFKTRWKHRRMRIRIKQAFKSYKHLGKKTRHFLRKYLRVERKEPAKMHADPSFMPQELVVVNQQVAAWRPFVQGLICRQIFEMFPVGNCYNRKWRVLSTGCPILKM